MTKVIDDKADEEKDVMGGCTALKKRDLTREKKYQNAAKLLEYLSKRKGMKRSDYLPKGIED